MRHVLVDEEYRPLSEPDSIIDIGANIGVATIYLHRLFPRARIIAVEADPGTFQTLQYNVGSLPGVVTVNAAIVGADGPVVFYPSRNSLVSSTAPRMGRKTTVRGITIATLMHEHGLDTVDLAKIDIEGEEMEALRAAPLARVHEVIAEIHHERVDTNEAALKELFSGFELTLRAGDTPMHSLLHAWQNRTP